MNEILFFLFSFLTIFLSIKLSVYSDILSSIYGASLIGGILLAGVTALPEFVTSISSIYFNNPYLAIGDIYGANLFNIFMISFFDIIFLNKRLYFNVNRKYIFIYLILIINYFVMIYFKNYASLIIIFIYILYLIFISKIKLDDSSSVKSKPKNLILKLVLVIILLMLSSILLTFIVNKITIKYSFIASSIFGAILLGITTSLPEVITFYTLLKLDNYDLALSNIIGSNVFNLLVLAITSFFINNNIYNFIDDKSFTILILNIIFSFISIILISRKRKSRNKYFYVLPSVIMLIIYILSWFMNFVY